MQEHRGLASRHQNRPSMKRARARAGHGTKVPGCQSLVAIQAQFEGVNSKAQRKMVPCFFTFREWPRARCQHLEDGAGRAAISPFLSRGGHPGNGFSSGVRRRRTFPARARARCANLHIAHEHPAIDNGSLRYLIERPAVVNEQFDHPHSFSVHEHCIFPQGRYPTSLGPTVSLPKPTR